MSLTTLRRAFRPQRNLLRHLLLSLALVTTIVASLLAMHSLNVEHAASDSSFTVVAAVDHHEVGVALSATPATATNDCGGACKPEHLMTTMACVLALLLSALLVGVIRVIAWRPVRNRIIAFAEWATAQRLLAPPSLFALCISRT